MSEKLTLDQIKVLSDKMLISMFSEQVSDEIKKNYSFKCFLIPNKCSQIFKSFGSEARARCKMKAHLQSHIRELLSGKKGKANIQFTAKPLHIRRKQLKGKANIQFTAKPLHVRRKRLKELNAKRVPKRKRGKRYRKKKKDSSALEYFQNDDFKNVEPRKRTSNLYKNSKNTVCTSPSQMHAKNFNNDFEKCTSAQFNQDPVCASIQLVPLTPEEEARHYENITLKDYSVDGYFEPDISLMEYNLCPKRSKGSNATDFEYIMGWNIDLGDTSLEGSSYDTPNNSEEYLAFQHDHLYTSIYGKAYYDPSFEKFRKEVTTTRKDVVRTCSCWLRYLQILPTAPFPSVYIPLHPEIAETLEVERDASCKTCSTNDDLKIYCKNTLNSIFSFKPTQVDQLEEEFPLFSDEFFYFDNEENTASDYAEHLRSFFSRPVFIEDTKIQQNEMRKPGLIQEEDEDSDSYEEFQSLILSILRQCNET